MMREQLSDDVTLHHGNCLDVMAEMEANSIDAVVTDPPYGLQFMGKEWDHGVPGEVFWIEALRVAKPGAWLLAFGGTRTWHRLAVAIEDAGWELRDTIMWVYGSGFPKSHNVSKAIDKMLGAERGIVGRANGMGKQNPEWNGTAKGRAKNSFEPEYDITAPATPEAKQWDGWGTALKPAWEPVLVARKPIVGTVAGNVLEWGTGGINIDGCRIGTDDNLNGGSTVGSHGAHEGWRRPWMDNPITNIAAAERSKERVKKAEALGRWPANFIHDGSDEVVGLFPMTKSSGDPLRFQKSNGGWKSQPYGNQVVTSPCDSGSAARYFYCAKASKRDRNEGLEEMPLVEAQSTGWSGDSMPLRQNGTERKMPIKSNPHPTVKPTDLMRYLCRLVTPPGGTVLDPFMGSGSTGKAAMLEGFNFVGIELDADSVEIASRRIEHARKQPRLV